MYIPASFRESRIERLHEMMLQYPLGLLVIHSGGALDASPLPFLLYADEGEQGVLRAHMAKANPHWKSLAEPVDCLVVFQGEDAYVTPSWYPSKASNGKAVPTWNYVTVQVRGRLRLTDDAAWLRRQLNDLTAWHERPRPHPWAIGDAPAEYIASQMEAIIGIEIPISHIEGKWKMSQNKDAADRVGVIKGMRSEADPHRNIPVADVMER